MQRHYLLIDANNLGHVANSMKPLTIGSMEVQAIYGFLRLLRGYVEKYSFATPVVLWDGMSWRKQVFADYKANRDRAETKSEIAKKQQNQSYQRQRPHIEKALSFLGVTQVKAMNMEADDLAAIMVKLYVGQGAKVTLLTEDQDWLQLVQPNVAMERPRNKDRVTVMSLAEITGCVNAAQFVEKKALMGDAGDNVPGIGGVGEKRALEFLAEYGSFHAFLEGVMISKTIDFASLPKWKRDLVDDEEKAIKFANNMRLVDLNTTARPAPKDLIVSKGEPSAENFRKMCDLLLFRTMTDNFDTWISPFPVSRTIVASAA